MLIPVSFEWSDEHGRCQQCNLPVAFYVVDAYGPGDHMMVDAVCAANFAADGSVIRRIDDDYT